MNRQRLKALLESSQEQLSNWLVGISDWLRTARTKDIDFSTVKAYLSQAGEKLQLLAQRNYRPSIDDIRPWMRQHGRKLSLYLALPIAVILLTLLIQQQTTRLNHALSLRPAQLTTLESLIQDSKSASVTDSTPTLTDTEIETLRVILQNRGITPNILRLNLEQGGSVEFQTDQAAFGQWVTFLEEAARRWHLFPTQLTIKATDSPEVVSIRAVLQQNPEMVP